jgi:uncharacterized protein
VNYLKIGLLGFFTVITFNSYGFSCDSPQSTLEISICQDDDLKRLNAVYNEYQFRVQKINMQSADDIGRELYVNLRKCNDDKNCLVDTYKESIQSLLSVISKNDSQQKPVGIEKPTVNSSQVVGNKSNTSWLDMFENYTLNDYSLLLNAYLFLVGILYLLTRMYSTKNFLTKTLFFIIGFPFVLIGWVVTLVNIRSDRHRYLDENQSGGEYSDDGSPKDIKKSTHFQRLSPNKYKISEYIQAIKEIYILQEHILREIENHRKQYGLYNSIYIRRGDKSKENSIDPIEQILEHTNLKESPKKLFVQADDYRAVKDVKEKLPSVEVVSITPEEKLGANAGEITKLDGNNRKLETENFLISIGIFLGGEECWTDIRSNVGRFHKLCDFKRVKYYPDNKNIHINKESTPYDLAPAGKAPL